MPDARFADQGDEGLAAAVEDRHFEVVDLDVGVIDAHRVEHAQQMLRGGDEDALPHQAGRVADARDMPPTGGDLEILEIGADENDAGGDRRGEDANADRDAAVESDAGRLHGALNRRFKPQANSPDVPYLYFRKLDVRVQVFDM